MIQNYSKYKTLKVFLDSPSHSFKIREIARITKIATTSTKNNLDYLEKEGLILAVKEKNYSNYVYRANRENPDFIFMQKLSTQLELQNSQMIEYLWEILSPQAIILYGSYAKGEAMDNSDIDLFIIGKEKPLNIDKYEKMLGKKVHLSFSESFSKLQPELKNNLVNGIILKGYLKVY